MDINLQKALWAALQAAKKVKHLYDSQTYTISQKQDTSYLTSADLASHFCISEILSSTQLPIVSEESEFASYEERKTWKSYWCIDPIDGTLEFVNRTDEYCISIGLIEENTSVLGVLIAPSLNKLYFAEKSIGSFVYNDDLEQLYSIETEEEAATYLLQHSLKLPINKTRNDVYTLLGSRSFRNEKDEAYLQKVESEKGTIAFFPIGSAIKLGFLSEGNFHEYTRFHSVHIWDIAGGHAIAKYAGLIVKDMITQQEITYDCEDMLIPNYTVKWNDLL